jgi:hypothetical protein
VLQLFTHLTTAEVGYMPVLKSIAAGNGGSTPEFDRDRWNASQITKNAEAEPAGLRARIERAHASMLDYLAEVTPEQLDQQGLLSNGEPGSLADGFTLVAAHKREHAEQMAAAIGANA